jgi:hypothetical protein
MGKLVQVLAAGLGDEEWQHCSTHEQKDQKGGRWGKIWTSTHLANNSCNAVVSTYHCMGYRGCITILYIGTVKLNQLTFNSNYKDYI